MKTDIEQIKRMLKEDLTKELKIKFSDKTDKQIELVVNKVMRYRISTIEKSVKALNSVNNKSK